MSELPIACTLDESQRQAGREQLLPGLSGRAGGVEGFADGSRFRFPATTENLTAIVQTIDAERRCCRFLRFDLMVEPDSGPMWLAVTGPAGTRECLAGLTNR